MNAEQVYAILKKRIDSKGVTQDKVDKAIQSYLERNPIKKLEYNSETRALE